MNIEEKLNSMDAPFSVYLSVLDRNGVLMQTGLFAEVKAAVDHLSKPVEMPEEGGYEAVPTFSEPI